MHGVSDACCGRKLIFLIVGYFTSSEAPFYDDICTCLIWTVASGGCCEYTILIAEYLIKNLWILKEKSMYVKYI
jgi:hypothetical protein